MKNPALKPKVLQKGDTIGIVAPSGPLTHNYRDSYLAGKDYLTNRGFKILEGKNLFQKQGYLAGNDAERLADLHDMVANPDVKAVFIARGGYGLTRLLPSIDYDLFRQNPKIIVGYSDVTALQNALYTKNNQVTFSGPMVAIEMGTIHPYTNKHFWPMIQNQGLFKVGVNEMEIVRPGKGSGKILGGCLSVLCSLLGTPFLPDFAKSILIIEDVNEELYKIDRYFSQLKNAGVLNKIGGLLVGQFIWGENPKNSVTLKELIVDYTAGLNIPVIMNIPYGHGERKMTVPFGCNAIIDTESFKIETTEPGVLNE